ncbi:class I adenylate-forming enzyme family protein [Kitasatospora sp. A2-31]|uniref:class I adenylate-forming enzyme family protein n=1 Tax=Kitasatospora sp. A2-31 TaxID=2916414 RepID=UPI001EEBD71D|nr:class I adenylate-forming enzyme family protein [Kitasatospora sp. A2-31]MCG6495357.1 acyl--CoA ligase [Kitasatospora sp. A2-31]
MSSIVEAVRGNAAPPDATALVAGGRAWTYRELLAAAERVAGALRGRQVPDEPVTARLSAPAAYAVLVLGCDLAGVPLVHQDPAAPAPAGSVVPTVLDTDPDGPAGPTTVLCAEPPLRLTGSGRSELPAGVPAGAHVFLTSGSTGTPTGVVRTAAAVLADARRVGTFLGYRPDAPVTVAAPLFHAYGFNYGLIAPLALGAPARIRPARSVPSQLANAVRADGARALVALPFHYALLTKAADPGGTLASALAPLATAVSAGAPLGPGVAAAIAERFAFRLHNCYGSSEAGAVTLAPATAEAEDGAVGAPLPGVEARVVPLDDGDPHSGELRLRTSSLAAGRIGPDGLVPLDLDADGWYRTGDLARTATEHGIRLAGRIGTLINVAGKKVAPVEVERVLARHPAVADVRVTAAPDAAHGQVPVAAVVLRADAPDLVPWCRERLAPHQVPRRIDVVAEIPRSATGKALAPGAGR